jgi:peptidoglycan/xylan/chitin deacetylase (PgdA/CDA1 family)
MKTFLRFLSKQAGRFLPAQWLFKRNTPCFLPFYHVVSDEKLPHILNYPYRNILQFEKELDFFLAHFQPVSLDELVTKGCAAKKVFHLSFDDGLRECAEVVAPLLLKKGIPATFFVNTAFVDNKGLFHKYKASLILNRLREKSDLQAEKILATNGLAGEHILTAGISQVSVLNKAAEILGIDFNEFLAKQKPYLTTAQIQKMAGDGFTIGAHSHSHPEFWEIPVQTQIDEVKKSMAEVEGLVKPRVKAFSFPFTDWGVRAEVLSAIKKEQICDITFGTAGVKQDMFDFHLQRYPAEQSGDFKCNLKGEFVYFEWRKWVGKAVVKH